jgi:hypothetical protein
MIKVNNYDEDIKINKYFYDIGKKWIFCNTFDDYIINAKQRTIYPYYVQDVSKYINCEYIRLNDMWEITVPEFFNNIRKKKLNRILNE